MAGDIHEIVVAHERHALAQEAYEAVKRGEYGNLKDIEEKIRLLGCDLESMLSFFMLDDLGNPGDIQLNEDEKKELKEVTAPSEDDPEDPMAAKAAVYAKGFIYLDQVLEKRHLEAVKGKDSEEDFEQIEGKINAQRFAMMLAWRFIDRKYNVDGKVLPKELGWESAPLSNSSKLVRGFTHASSHLPEAPVIRGEKINTFNKLELGNRIREARIRLNIVQREIAEGDFSVSYVSAVERGQILPSLDALEIISKKLNTSIPALLLGDRYKDMVGSYDDMTMYSVVNVGKNIRKARIGRKMIQTALAKGESASDSFSVSYISAVERGQIKPSLTALSILCQRLDISFEDVFRR